MSGLGLAIARADGAGVRSRVFDIVLACVMAALITIGVWAELAGWPHPVAFPVGAYAIGLAAAAVLLVRRKHPFVCTIVVLVLIAGYHAAGYPGGAPVLALFVALESLAAYAGSAWWIAVAVLVVFVWQVIPALPPTPTPWDSYATTGPAMGLLFIVALGAIARQSRIGAERALAAARETATAQARERIAEERLAIARDVHDVLAHSISAIAVQSASALDAFDSDPAGARRSMERVRSLAKQSMPELHRTVTALRGDAQTDASQPPQPSLADLEDLFEVARQSGLTVRADTGGLHAVGPITGLCAYRIVQEALTNVVRHSDASVVNVSLHVAGDELVVNVTDDGTTAQADLLDAPATGFGIRGMGERAAAVGGTVRAGPRPEGGFEVRAVLPIGADVAARAVRKDPA